MKTKTNLIAGLKRANFKKVARNLLEGYGTLTLILGCIEKYPVQGKYIAFSSYNNVVVISLNCRHDLDDTQAVSLWKMSLFLKFICYMIMLTTK